MMLSFKQRSLFVSLAALVAHADSTLAHQKWLWPNRFLVPKEPAWVSFDVTWSDEAFAAADGVGANPLSVVSPDGNRSEPESVFIGKTKSTAEVELTKPGTYRLEAIDPATYWTRVTIDGKEQWIKRPKAEVPDGKITRADLYYSAAAAYVTVGAASNLPPTNERAPLEIIPKSHPSELESGSAIEVQVLSYGKPANAAEVRLFGPAASGHEPEQTVTCDEHGRAAVPVRRPGRHLISCELERPATDDPKADVHSFNYYLTVWVSDPK